MRDNDETPTTPAPHLPLVRRRRTPVIVAAGVALLGAAVFSLAGVAAAQDSGSPSPTARADEERDRPFRDRMWQRLGPMGRHGPMMGGSTAGMAFGGIHAEATVPDGEGGYRTMLTQVGEVTAVSAGSITVRSEDGYRHTYAITDDTSVDAGRGGIGDVAVGHEVHLVAHVQDGTDTAVRIGDLTRMRQPLR